MLAVPTYGYWFNTYSFIVGRLSFLPPGTIFTWFVHTNAEFKLFFGLYKLCEPHGA